MINRFKSRSSFNKFIQKNSLNSDLALDNINLQKRNKKKLKNYKNLEFLLDVSALWQ